MNPYKIGKTELILLVSGVVVITILMFFLNIHNKTNIPYPLAISILLSAIVTLFIWVGCRVIVKLLWEKYPWEKHPLKHLLIEVLIIPSWAFFVMFLSSELYMMTCNTIEPYDEWLQGLTNGILITLLITSIHEGVYFYRQWKENFNLSLKLKKDNLEARYETLKAQLNPHFLFNSLNTLITYVDDNPKASEYVQNLSDFMRYVLKNREKEVILVDEEIESCEKYMFLQKSRFGNNLEWNVELNEYIKNMFIAPLTVQMLLENAIKHNIISKEKKLVITVGYDNNGFLFIENNLQKKMSESSTGIGLKNIFDRYEYFTTQKPRVEETSSSFKVFIPLVKTEL